MKLKDTTNPSSHHGCQTIISETVARNELDLVERFRIHIIGLYHAEVGPSWSSNGRQEGDFLHHIDLVCTGRLQVVHDGKVSELAPGWAWLLPGCAPVERRCLESGHLYFIKFRSEWLAGVDPLLDWPERQPLRLGRWDEAMIHNLRRADGSPDTKSLLVLQSQIYHWLAQSLPDLGQIISTHVQTHSRFEQVFELMETRLGADLQVCDLAAVMNLPLSAFSMSFSRCVGMSPKAWLSRRMNQEAIKRLIQSDAPIKDVAQQLRFADEYHFSRFFKRLNGIAPSSYRQKFFGRGNG